MDAGIPLSEERHPSMNSAEQILQDGGHLPRYPPRMYEEDERHQPISNPVDGLYSSEQI